MTHPNFGDISPLLEEVAVRAGRYLTGIADRTVAPQPRALDSLSTLVEPFPEAGTDANDVLALLDDVGSPASVAMAGPRYFGFVIGGAYPASLAANWLVSAWDQNAVLHEVTPAIATFESMALSWLLEALELPSQCGGAFVTGATVANLTGLAAARHSVLAHSGWDVEADGLFGAPAINVVVGQEAHPTLNKSLGLLGLGRSRVTAVPVDRKGAMRLEAIPKLAGPTIICTQAGNINTGSFDPIGEICDLASGSNTWVHVDGAFGLWAMASPDFAKQTEGIKKADSWATDAHKWLNVPYDSGLCFVRDAHAIKAAMAVTAEYLPTDTPNRNPSDFTPELSRRARGVEVWAALKHLGREGLIDLVDRCCAHARRFARGLTDAGFEVLNDIHLNQVLVSFGSDERTRQVIRAVQEDGTCWAGGTVWQGRAAMRISVCNWSTTVADVEASIKAMINVANRLAR